VKAVRIHDHGGPEVLRYEDAPDPEPGPDQVLVELRAASLNHLDIWVRKGPPSVPKPRILGADGAGVVVSGDGFRTGDRVVINRTHAELIAVPRSQVYAIPDTVEFETAAAFPLVFETANRSGTLASAPALPGGVPGAGFIASSGWLTERRLARRTRGLSGRRGGHPRDPGRASALSSPLILPSPRRRYSMKNCRAWHTPGCGSGGRKFSPLAGSTRGEAATGGGGPAPPQGRPVSRLEALPQGSFGGGVYLSDGAFSL
jgi:hypothetical protein